MLALVWATKHFRPYLYGRHFTVRTDHASLRWLQSFHEPEGQVARWLECLSEYDFEVVHRPGSKHTNAAALSRMPCPQCQLLVQQVATVQSDILLPCWTLEELAEEQRQDPNIRQVIQWLENECIPPSFSKASVLTYSSIVGSVLLSGSAQWGVVSAVGRCSLQGAS